jgi:hypothetical protein
VWFGTFIGTMEAKDKDGVKARSDAKSTLRAVPTGEFTIYLALSCALVAAWAAAATGALAGAEPWAAKFAQDAGSWEAKAALAAGVGFGPVLLATVVSVLFGGVRPNAPGKMGALGNLLHLTVGSAFCSVPVAWACWLALTPSGSAGARTWLP